MNAVLSTRQVSLFHVWGLLNHSVPNHLATPIVAFSHDPSARWASVLILHGLDFAIP